jgi:hypothetical protein
MSFDVTVGLEGGAESVGLAGDDRKHDNRGQETGRDPRAEKSGRDRCPEHVRAAAMVEAAGVAWPRTLFSPQIGNGEFT